MTLRSYITNLTRSEFEQIVAELNLTDEENNILYLVKKGKSNVQIADACCCSLATIGNRIKHINTKLNKIGVIE